MTGTRRIVILLIAAVLIAALAWQIPLPGQDAIQLRTENRLVIITPHNDAIRTEFRRAFCEWYNRKTGDAIDVEYLDPGGTSDCVKYIVSEFRRSPKGIQADLFFGGGTDPYLKLKDEGYLARVEVDSTILADIPQQHSGIQMYDADQYWYGACLSGFGIVYNKWVTRWMDFDTPREWKDLADPRYFTWVGAADPRSSGTMHLMFEIILQAYGWDRGWEILSGLAANTKGWTKGANQIPKMTAQGEIAFGLAIDFYGWAQVARAGEDKMGFCLPDSLTVVGADAMAMLKGAPRPDAARSFIEFVLSEEGQTLWYTRMGTPNGPKVQELNRMAVRPDLYDRFKDNTVVKQNPFASRDRFPFNHVKASQRWAISNDLIGIALIDHSQSLQKAWARSIQSGRIQDPAWKAMPVTEEECIQLAKNEWKDPVEKNRVLLEWHEFFEEKYKKLQE